MFEGARERDVVSKGELSIFTQREAEPCLRDSLTHEYEQRFIQTPTAISNGDGSIPDQVGTLTVPSDAPVQRPTAISTWRQRQQPHHHQRPSSSPLPPPSRLRHLLPTHRRTWRLPTSHRRRDSLLLINHTAPNHRVRTTLASKHKRAAPSSPTLRNTPNLIGALLPPPSDLLPQPPHLTCLSTRTHSSMPSAGSLKARQAPSTSAA